MSGSLFDRLLAPWAFEQSGRPPLTGYWVGNLTTATGQTYGVLLEIRLPEPKGRGGLVRDWENAPYGEFAGTARSCDANGQLRVYTVEGEPDDRQASQITFYATPSEEPAPNGLTLSWVKGVWDGGSSLTLTAELYWRQDEAAISGPEYPDTQSDAVLPMIRGTEEDFQTICDQIRVVGA